MLIIPAIDLKGGKVVRLFQGKFDREKVYSSDPVKAAKHWARQGAKFLHIVDLDGAESGKIRNAAAVKNIIRQVGVGVEFGGGVRSMDTISGLLKLGVERVILGTKAADDPAFLKKARNKFGDRIIVSIDAKDGKVLTKGWKSGSARTVSDFAGELKGLGFKQVIYTDVSKDGTLAGPDIAGIKKLLKETGMGVIASGGVSDLKDLAKLKALKKQGLSAVIVGKALYEGKFTLTEARIKADS
ncbi:MAG: 1-(5-phosphoribosyl)-5-[(5-phosphoribosylamino)methylideneamino]imidazole-4-carboxamide isomerase [Candidatus Omnitrophica bacterium]|jgi:phosphoribosylformimino-5-aminoimidazole carboxamide ribotide isomerase|nr:1-(5-phosphoribosyl)-5-[(5-phosphoribosylamino)methylideneamino]imidazole-4-carboxamide isomerase [Candidatus Omnitrophota bacterium]MDD3274968.1 1-(5-phosphoribosyl)-5-[(5-phosphoribosylamino)methylideneamino]imidazole-4-carboxamide isomerase [Candidatus Omnitrophota bacterium]